MAALVVAAVLSTGCTTTPASQVIDRVADASPQPSPRPVIEVPIDGSVTVDPADPVTVTVGDGHLTSVTLVDQRSRSVPGEISADGSSWEVQPGALRLGRSYRLTASASNDHGLTTTRSAVFDTVTPRKVLVTSISPLDGQTVGVGMPIVVRFNARIRDRAAVESALRVTASRPAEGSWSWVADDEVHYRPREFWPAYTDVRLDVGLRSVHAGGGVWGKVDRVIRFRVGSAMVSVVDVDRHRMTVWRNGKKVRVVPVSTGKKGFLTRNGTKVILEKYQLKVMDASTIGIGAGNPEYYRLDVPYAMRVTWSGEFVHAAPWSARSQGRDNVSHGCVGMSMAHAIWLFERSSVGDVVRVVGSPRELEPGNGYTDWNVSWADWKAGSALTG